MVCVCSTCNRYLIYTIMSIVICNYTMQVSHVQFYCFFAECILNIDNCSTGQGVGFLRLALNNTNNSRSAVFHI